MRCNVGVEGGVQLTQFGLHKVYKNFIVRFFVEKNFDIMRENGLNGACKSQKLIDVSQSFVFVSFFNVMKVLFAIL